MKNISTPLAFLFSIALTITGHPTFAKSCLQRQGALDIGSGSTKALAAVVDTCERKIVEIIYEGSRPISFNDALEKSKSSEIPKELIEEASQKISALITDMKNKDVVAISAIATSAFRVAKNGQQAASDLSDHIKVPVKIITQDEEAEIGYVSATSRSKTSSSLNAALIVWDIGGGSMQMRAKTKTGAQLFKGDLASVTFKNRVIQDIQSKNPKDVSSPNPIGKDFEKAISMAMKHAKANVPPFFKQSAHKAHWIGIGGVLAISTQNQVDSTKKSFSRAELERTLSKRAYLKDEEIKSEYRTTDITNLALVLGYMKALGINVIETADSSLLRGWLLYNASETPKQRENVAEAI